MPSFDAIIIGTGQAGSPLAGRLTEAGMKVAIIERNLFGGTCVAGFDMNSLYSAAAAVIGAIVLLALYHAFFRRKML